MGLVVSDLLVENFPDIMDPKFTATMETDLDRVAEGQASWQQIMRDFYEPFRPGTGRGQRRDAQGEERPHRAQMPRLRRRTGGALGQKRRISRVLRLPQVRLHRGF